jgi:HEAT repeat protein
MHDLLGNVHIRLSLSTALALMGIVLLGCHAPSACDPPGGTAGTFVRTKNSDAYLAEMNKTGGDVAHVACRAESNIETQVLFLRNSQLAPEDPKASGGSGPMTRAGSSGYDPRIMPQRENIGTFAGKYRVLGLGRGVSEDDCAAAAVGACDEAIDSYWRKQNAARPIGEPCHPLDDHERCPAQGGYSPGAVASAEPEPAARNEPPLAALVKKLDDDRTRADAVKGIIQFFENAKKRADGDVTNANVKTLLDQIIEPMAKAYTDGKLDDATRGELIRFLADARDARAGRAWIKALGSEDDVEWAALGIGATVYQEGAPALGEAFTKLEAGTPKGSKAGKNVQAAMLALKNPAWKALLLERVARPLEKPAGGSDAAKTTAYRNELYWQTTSAEVLGELRDATTTKSLLKILLDPSKVDVAPAAALGIAAIGKDAVPALLDALAGKDAELVELAKSKAADNGGNAKTYVAAAAFALGEMGCAEARDALVRASKSADNDANRAAVALALAKLPASPEAEKAFESVYEKLAPGAKVAITNAAARTALLDASVQFYDPEIVPWLLKQAKAAKGADSDDVRASSLRTALVLMKGAQVPAVAPIVEKLGDDHVKEAYRSLSQLVETCDVATDCYEAKLAESHSPPVAVKAAYTLGVLGDAKTAAHLVEQLPKFKADGAQAAALAAVDHLAKDGGKSLADALEKQEAEGWPPHLRGAIRRTVLRLRAR